MTHFRIIWTPDILYIVVFCGAGCTVLRIFLIWLYSVQAHTGLLIYQFHIGHLTDCPLKTANLKALNYLLSKLMWNLSPANSS